MTFPEKKPLVFLIQYPFITVSTQRCEHLIKIILCLESNHIFIPDVSVQFQLVFGEWGFNVEPGWHRFICFFLFFNIGFFSWFVFHKYPFLEAIACKFNFSALFTIFKLTNQVNFVDEFFRFVLSSSIPVSSFSLERTSFWSSLSFPGSAILLITKHVQQEYWVFEPIINSRWWLTVWVISSLPWSSQNFPSRVLILFMSLSMASCWFSMSFLFWIERHSSVFWVDAGGISSWGLRGRLFSVVSFSWHSFSWWWSKF